MHRYDFVVFPETHVDAEGMDELLHEWGKAGYWPVAVPSRPSPQTGSQRAGGLAIGGLKR